MTDLLGWNGNTYRGARAVAEASGCSIHTVHWHLKAHGHLDRLGSGRWGGKSGAAATCGRRDEDGGSEDENRGRA